MKYCLRLMLPCHAVPELLRKSRECNLPVATLIAEAVRDYLDDLRKIRRVSAEHPTDSTKRTSVKIMLYAICFFIIPFVIGAVQAAVIQDSGRGHIYWGGKYVKIKPSAYTDVIGKRSAVDQMEVIMNNDVMTVRITGSYFFNYVHKIKRTQDAIPGDLYMSSRGWKVSGFPPYTEDIFEPSEGWDYVVSLRNKKVYTLRFSDIVMTSALPTVAKYRARQAWQGGYGEAIDEAEVTLTDSGLTFIFSIRNMQLGSEIGLHWTMKCGNDIIEGAALIPSIAVTPPVEPASGEEASPDPSDGLAMELVASPPPAVSVTTAFIPTTFRSAGLAPALAAIPAVSFRSSDPDRVLPPGSDPSIPLLPVEPPAGPEPRTSVAEPSTALLLLIGLFMLFTRTRLSR